MVLLLGTKSYHVGRAHLGNPCISQKEEKRFASIPAIFSCLSVQRSEKFCGLCLQPFEVSGKLLLLWEAPGNTQSFSHSNIGWVIFQSWKASLLPAKASIHLLLPPSPAVLFAFSFILAMWVLLKSQIPQMVITGGLPNTQFKVLWLIRNFLADPTKKTVRKKLSLYIQVSLVKDLAPLERTVAPLGS